MTNIVYPYQLNREVMTKLRASLPSNVAPTQVWEKEYGLRFVREGSNCHMEIDNADHYLMFIMRYC